MQLVIAEKPSVARDLARVLGIDPAGKRYFAGRERVITWCIGHLVELVEPGAYDPRWKAWRLDTLPMIPARFVLGPVAATRDQLDAVCKLLGDGRFQEVINACDAGREGELIFRYVYALAGSRLPVRRLWISSLTEEAIRQGFARLLPGARYDALGDAARCRSEADWLVGMNATRAVTLRRREALPGAGHATAPGQKPRVYSLGRVQTPTLALVVRRDEEIAHFVPRDYWEVRGELMTREGAVFAGWLVHEEPRALRFASQALADAVVTRDTAHGQANDPLGPRVVTLQERQTRESPPLLFDLTALQRTANRRFGMSAQRTLDVAQALYEKHKLITYPRTDSRHLSTDMDAQMEGIWRALGKVPEYVGFVAPLLQAKPARSRRVFDDAKVSDHHAIIPTGKAVARERLDGDEWRLFDLIARRFIGVFHPDAEFALTDVLVAVGPGERSGRELAALLPKATRTARAAKPTKSAATGRAAAAPARDGTEAPARDEEPVRLATALPGLPDHFLARGKVRLVAGWQAVAGIGEPRAGKEMADEEGDEDGPDTSQALPRLHQGERLDGQFVAPAKQTRPPPHYTEATLLGAMEAAGRDFDDEALRLAMKDRGLGTPATRAATIETLLQRGYLQRARKQVRATAMGRELVLTLPVPNLASAELTGDWEARLARVARGEEPRDRFMAEIAAWVSDVVAAIRRAPVREAPPLPARAMPLEKDEADAADARPERSSRGTPGRASAASVSAGRRNAQARRAVAVSGRSPRPKRSEGKARNAQRTARAPLREVPAAAGGGQEKTERTQRTPVQALPCPRCQVGHLLAGRRGWGCSRWREGCALVIWFELEGQRLREGQLRELVTRGKTRPVLWPRADGGAAKARVVLDVKRDQGAAVLQWV